MPRMKLIINNVYACIDLMSLNSATFNILLLVFKAAMTCFILINFKLLKLNCGSRCYISTVPRLGCLRDKHQETWLRVGYKNTQKNLDCHNIIICINKIFNNLGKRVLSLSIRTCQCPAGICCTGKQHVLVFRNLKSRCS